MSNFLTMFPVTYTFENGVYSTIINQNPNNVVNQNGLSGLEHDVQKLMVPIIETPQIQQQQLHIPQLTDLQSQSQSQNQLQQHQIQVQPQFQFQPTCSSSSSIIAQNQNTHMVTSTSSSTTKKYVNPFAPEATVPLPIELEDQFGPYSSSVWKRNERERCRVRNVNDGYERLRKHLPVHFDEKRISKVDTLRLAIRYIRHLDNLLKNHMHQYDCKCFNGFQEESEGNISIDISTFQFNSIAMC